MKKIIKYIVIGIIFCAIFTEAQAQKNHIFSAMKVVFYNHKNYSIFIGPHSNPLENCGISGFIEIKPNDYAAIDIVPDSIKFKAANGTVSQTYLALAFRLVNDKTKISEGEDYLIGMKNVIHIADTEGEAKNFAGKTGKAVGFASNMVPPNNMALGYLVNNSDVSVYFSDPRFPFYGKTLAPYDSLEINSTQKKQWVTTGFINTDVYVVRKLGDNPTKNNITIPIYENSKRTVITNEFFDLAANGTGTKFYPMKIYLCYSPCDILIENAFDKNGQSIKYPILAMNNGIIIYLKEGENSLNIKYSTLVSNSIVIKSQPLNIIATKKGVKYLVYTDELKNGNFIVNVIRPK